jgi:hypothetical protein
MYVCAYTRITCMQGSSAFLGETHKYFTDTATNAHSFKEVVEMYGEAYFLTYVYVCMCGVQTRFFTQERRCECIDVSVYVDMCEVCTCTHFHELCLI